jgi:hypothetical protein
MMTPQAIVKVVCHTAGKVADGLHLLRLYQLLLDELTIRDVLHCACETADDAVRIGHRLAFHAQHTHFAIRTDDPGLA